jgi:preprotein translocase subunit SecG
MIIVFLILIVVASVALGFVVLIQNPKGGGLSGNVGGLSNQFMGVKQTTDVLEKGTWLFAIVIGLLCIFSTLFMKGGTSADVQKGREIPTNINTPAPTKPSTPTQSGTTTMPQGQ